MKVRMFRLFSLISLLVIPGICSQEWKIQYSNMMKCVLKGSTTRFSGTYKHPDHLTVTETFWTLNPVKGEKLVNLSDLPDYRGRVQYFPGDKSFLLKLSNVRHEDKGMYCFRIMTNVEEQRYVGFPGIELRVTELRVEIPEEVVEKDSPVLFCKSTCNLSGRTNFTWYKNGERLSEWSGTNQLLLQSVSSDDTGNYSCAARDQEHLPSPAVTLSVRYPPKSVSVSISPSGEIVSGDSVTLNCSSDSNPPALNFSWFKENETSAVGSGQSFSISSFNSSFSGRFYCEAQNKYGSQRSASVSLTVKGVQRAALHTVSGIVAGCGGLIFIIIIIIIIIIVFIKKKRRDGGADVIRQNQEDRSDRSAETALTNDTALYSLVSANQRDDLYANIKAKKPERSGRKQTETDSGDVGEVQYASVHHFKNKDMKKTEENDCQTIETHHPSEANRSEDSIYSSCK
ncbi:B-cell receptor CD22-like [Ctenopharyngodon idella]|uniref:B-cell receptor CD22-like n=1 Tax=Ctenopharyngodon idella TaxID=7959 RepID=UPI00223128B4|nr:B-cell receptor CD22-like [Ctenopharyngodon idella]